MVTMTRPPSSPMTTDTTLAGLIAIAPKLSKQRAWVWAYVKLHGPSTDEEICRGLRAAGLPIGLAGARTRRKELVYRAIMVDTGLRRPGVSGLDAAIWAIEPPDDPDWLEEQLERRELIRLAKLALYNHGSVGDDLARKLGRFIYDNLHMI